MVNRTRNFILGNLGKYKVRGLEWAHGGQAGEKSKARGTTQISIKEETSELSSNPRAVATAGPSTTGKSHDQRVMLNHRAASQGF